MNAGSKIVVSLDMNQLDQFITDKRGDVRDGLLEQLDKQLIQHCLTRFSNNQTRVADVLGINRLTLRNRMLALGIKVER